MLLLSAAAGCTSAPVHRPPPPLKHVLDETAWVVDHPVDWPGPDHSVLVYFDVVESTSICGRTLNRTAREALRRDSSALFGRACGHLVVLIEPLPESAGSGTRRLLAAHEAFHVAVHSNSLLPRLDTAFFPGTPDAAEIRKINRLARDLVALFRREPASDEDVCRRLTAGYRGLSPAGRAYFSYQSYWEWPAEFYMRETALGGRRFDEYVIERNALLPGAPAPLYVAGPLVMRSIERRMGRAAWQRRYVEGESILNLLAESVGCPALEEHSPQVDSFHEPGIFEAGSGRN